MIQNPENDWEGILKDYLCLWVKYEDNWNIIRRERN